VASQNKLIRRASFDLDCPVDQLKVTEIDYISKGVVGCDRRAAYIWSMNLSSWILNSASQRSSLSNKASLKIKN